MNYRMKRNNANWLSISLLLLIGFLLYGWSVGFDYVAYDDIAYVRDNPYVSQGITPEGLRWAFLYDSPPGALPHEGVQNLWHPLTWISHMLDVQLFGADQTQAFHAVNLGIYLLTIPFVFLGSRMIVRGRLAAFLLTLLWMVHPLKAESVAWISERKDLLSGCFFWSSLWLALIVMTSPEYRGRRWWQVLSLALFILGLLSKPSVIVLPPLLILLSGYIQGEREWKVSFLLREARKWSPWIVASIVMALITITLQSSGSHQDFMAGSALSTRLLSAASGIWYYVYRVLIPWDLNFYYPQPFRSTFLLLLCWAALGGVTWLTWVKRRVWRSWFLGYAWLLVCLLPVSGIIYVGASFTADRYMYLALAGILIPLVTWMGRWSNALQGVMGGALALIWAVLCFFQVGVWRNSWTLFEHSVQAQPRAAIGWSNLATLQEKEGLFTEAVASYHKSLEIQPHNYITYYNLGQVCTQTQELDRAAEYYQKSLEIYPNYLPAAMSLGRYQMSLGDYEAAKQLFYRGIERDYRMIWLAFECEFKLQNFGQARSLIQKLERLNVPNPEILAGMKKAQAALDRLSPSQ